jgi:hypothetical protein
MIGRDPGLLVTGGLGSANVAEKTTAAMNAAEAVQGVRKFTDENGIERLAVAKETDATPAIRAGLVYSRSEWTKLRFDDNQYDALSKLPDVRKFTANGERQLGVPPKGNLLFTKAHWPEEVEREYANRDQPKFTRAAWTELTCKPGTAAYKALENAPNISKSRFGKKLGIASGKNLLPYKEYWHPATKREYEAGLPTSREMDVRRNERAKVVGRGSRCVFWMPTAGIGSRNWEIDVTISFPKRQSDVSEAMVVAGQTYLGTCGAVDNPSLTLSDAFAEHMLQTILEECGEPYGRISGDVQARAVEYFTENRDPEDSMSITYSDFVRGLLTYALTGVDPYALDAVQREAVVKFPATR